MIQNRFIALATLLLILLLPLAQLTWVAAHKAHAPTRGEVPITAYDPRDLLRGRYITYRYVWNRAVPKPPLPVLPDRGNFYVDERDADLLQQVLSLPDLEGASVTYTLMGNDVVPDELRLSGLPYHMVLACLHAKPKVTDAALRDCSTPPQ